MKQILMFILVIAGLGLSAPTTTQASEHVCFGSRIDNVDVLVLGPLAHIAAARYGLKNRALIDAILALHGRETWVGYEHGGFDPITTYWNAVITIHWNDAGGDHINWLWVGNAGDDTKRQVYWFPSMDEYTDAQGKHMGAHPICGWHAIEVSSAVIDDLMALAGLS
jgi:hypothetical protein